MDVEKQVGAGQRIRYFRKLRGWSQEQLALQAEINPAFLGHLERSLKSPTETTLSKITYALNLTMGQFYADDILADKVDGPSEAMDRIMFMIQNLDEADLDRLADLIAAALNFKNGTLIG